MNEFEEFWKIWPNKKAKKAARVAFKKAREIASLETILNGVHEYVEKKEEFRAWMHPATFLNGERWEDEYESANSLKAGLFSAYVALGGERGQSGGNEGGSRNGAHGSPESVVELFPRAADGSAGRVP